MVDNRFLIMGALAGVVAVFILKNKYAPHLGSPVADAAIDKAVQTTKIANLAYRTQRHWL
jgi:hypothetical protein